MTQSTVDAATERAERALRRDIRGAILVPGDERYDSERLSWHRGIDPRPALVAEATTADDVATAVRVARAHPVTLAIQSTGHGTLVPADGGLLLRTSPLAGVQVDPRRRVARAEAGALWSDVIAAAAPHGLAPLSGTPAIGVVGYTLGGGAGWLSRTYGYAADSVVSADVVTADGATRTVDAERHSELFWALRGGGGSFAAVTALEFRLYPVTEVYSGMAMYPADRAAEVLAAYRDWAPGEPDELNTSVMVMQVPQLPQLPEQVRGRRVLAIRAFGVGDDVEARLRPLVAAAGEPLVDGFARMSFAEAAAAAGPPTPPMAVRQHFDLFDELPEALLSEVVESAAVDASPDLMAVELRHWCGAMADPPRDHGPVGHRDVPYSVLLTAPASPDTASSVPSIARRLRPYAHGGSFLNFQSDPSRTETAYTSADYRRLTQAKRTWDPDNLFGPTHNIAPAQSPAVAKEER